MDYRSFPNTLNANGQLYKSKMYYTIIWINHAYINLHNILYYIVATNELVIKWSVNIILTSFLKMFKYVLILKTHSSLVTDVSEQK